jgi:Fur family ferric uptake transcriptional regulator
MRIILVLTHGTLSTMPGQARTTAEGERPLAEWAEHAFGALERGGYRGGKARGAVIDFLSRQECCLSATEIFAGLRAEGRLVGLASVYRALEQLSSLRVLQRLDFGDSARYEPLLPGGDHHHHVVCDECGKVEPFADGPLELAFDRLRGRLGYELETHDVVLRGSCADCRASD